MPENTDPGRFVSLDVFRGLAVFVMILVNTAGPGAPAFSQLVHTRWIGFTLADLVFPSFLFAMGNAMRFALRRPLPARAYLARLIRRGAIIFVLGYLMYWYPFVAHGDAGWAWKPFALTRVPGVLQRLALCYVLAGLLVRWLDWRMLLVAAAALLLGYWAILVECAPAGMAFDKFANAGTRLDLWLLSPAHLYKKDGGFDPEGLLGTLPAVVNVLAGYLAGALIGWHRDRGDGPGVAVRRLLWIGAAAVLAGLAWSPWFPIAKKLWTGSYVLLTTGIDLGLIAAIIWVVDLRGFRAGAGFWLIMGRNPLAIYLFSELFVTTLGLMPAGGYHGVYDWLGIAVFQRFAPGAPGSLLCALVYTIGCWAVGWWLDRRGLILKV